MRDQDGEARFVPAGGKTSFAHWSAVSKGEGGDEVVRVRQLCSLLDLYLMV